MVSRVGLGQTALVWAGVGLVSWLAAAGRHTVMRPGDPDQPPRRIASLGLSVDEMLLELVPHQSLVGLTRWVDEPTISAAAGSAPTSAARLNEDVEQVLATEPDLVILPSYVAGETETLLRAAGLPVVRLGEVRSFADIEAQLAFLGRLVRAEPAAERLRADLEQSLGRARRAPGGPRVLFVGAGHAYGKGTLQAELLARAGLRNALDTRNIEGFVTLSAELVLVADPDALVVETDQRSVHSPGLARDIPGASASRAYQTGQVRGVPRSWTGSWSQYAARAVAALAEVSP